MKMCDIIITLAKILNFFRRLRVPFTMAFS